MGLGTTKKTFTLLDRIITILDATNNNVFFWPFLESTGIDIQSYKDDDEPLLSGEAGAYAELNDPATGWAPLMHQGGVYSYHFEGADDQHLEGADAANLSFNGTTDTAFSVGCWFYTEGATGTLISKYDVGGTLREWKFDLAAGPDLRLFLYDESATAEEGAQTTTALSTRRWYFGVATYGGAGGDGGGAAGDDILIYVDGALVADTDTDDAAYVDMEDSTAPLMIGATDDNAAPASEFTGRIALPFIVNVKLAAAQIDELYGIGKVLLGV